MRIIKWQKIILQRGSLASYLLSVHFRGKEVQNNVSGNKRYIIMYEVLMNLVVLPLFKARVTANI